MLEVSDQTWARFWSKVNKGTGCWEWTASLTGGGYGQFWSDPCSKRVDAHRWIAGVLWGPLVRTDVVCHRCDNPRCVRPSHLFVGTTGDNIRDMLDKGRGPTGVSNGMSKLTSEQVEDIRVSCEPRKSLADKYGVSVRHIYALRSGRYWKNE